LDGIQLLLRYIQSKLENSSMKVQKHMDKQNTISIIVPTKNEEVTVAKFISWCREGFKASNISGEIILVDSSGDRTPEIAKSMGATVITVERTGARQCI
jgi:cellulose synthase/poly-beta-1,6-N-acetylglucosamine synthase-like glycosyltransferase